MLYIVKTKAPLTWDISGKLKLNSDVEDISEVKSREYVENFGGEMRCIDWDRFEKDGFLEILSRLEFLIPTSEEFSEAEEIYERRLVSHYSLVDLDHRKVQNIRRILKIGIIENDKTTIK